MSSERRQQYGSYYAEPKGCSYIICSFSSCVAAILKAQCSQIQSSDPACYVTYCTVIHRSETQHNAVLKRTWSQFKRRQERTVQEREEEISQTEDKCSEICLVCVWYEAHAKRQLKPPERDRSNQTLGAAERYQVVPVTFLRLHSCHPMTHSK